MFFSEDATQSTALDKLNVVFQNGLVANSSVCFFNPIPYVEKKFSQASVESYITKEEARFPLVGNSYATIYVIDMAKENNLSCIPYSKFNAHNKIFIQGGESQIGVRTCCTGEKPVFLLLENAVPGRFIVGAYATQYLAFSLNISEETLIVNPNYLGDLQAIKDKLKVRNSKALEDCSLQEKNYFEAEAAYEWGPYNLDERFNQVIDYMEGIANEAGIEKVIYFSPVIKEIVDKSPFQPIQLTRIQNSLKASQYFNAEVKKASLSALAFERGASQKQCSISTLPKEIRYEIYSYVYPLTKNTELTTRKLQDKFAKWVLSSSDYDGVISKSEPSKQVLNIEEQSEDYEAFVMSQPSTSGLSVMQSSYLKQPLEEQLDSFSSEEERLISLQREKNMASVSNQLRFFTLNALSDPESETEQEKKKIKLAT